MNPGSPSATIYMHGLRPSRQGRGSRNTVGPWETVGSKSVAIEIKHLQKN